MVYVSRIIKECGVIVCHTDNMTEDVSFQKSAWTLEKREGLLQNALYISCSAGMKATDILSVIGFNQKDNSVRYVSVPDDDVLTKKDGNILITEEDVVLMGWAADCCLVALSGDNGHLVGVLHASVITLNNGVVGRAIDAMRSKGVSDVTAFIGACAGSCCYEYGREQAYKDFSNFTDFIIDRGGEKVNLALYSAVTAALKNAGVQKVVDIFATNERCSICSKDEHGDYVFPSYRRDVDVDGNHVNGQYGLFIQKA